MACPRACARLPDGLGARRRAMAPRAASPSSSPSGARRRPMARRAPGRPHRTWRRARSRRQGAAGLDALDRTARGRGWCGRRCSTVDAAVGHRDCGSPEQRPRARRRSGRSASTVSGSRRAASARRPARRHRTRSTTDGHDSDRSRPNTGRTEPPGRHDSQAGAARRQHRKELHDGPSTPRRGVAPGPRASRSSRSTTSASTSGSTASGTPPRSTSNYDVRRGEVLAIVGESGSGKSRSVDGAARAAARERPRDGLGQAGRARAASALTHATLRSHARQRDRGRSSRSR